ncbi:MAG: hypothetical protein JRG91_08425 [Deltaproteobacteria bacterium]|nr:hypothetical protein [Deltaproteobacteria bacterium]
MHHLKALAAITLVVGAALIALPALAGDKKDPAPIPEPKTAAVTIYDTWSDHLVPGDLEVPDGTYVSGKNKKDRPPTLIKVRTHFIPEMIKSVQKL